MSGPWGPVGDSQAWAPWEDPPTAPQLETDRMDAELATVRQPVAESFWLCVDCNSPAFFHPAYDGACQCHNPNLRHVTDVEADAINASLWDTPEAAAPDTLRGGNYIVSFPARPRRRRLRLGWVAWWVIFCLFLAGYAAMVFGSEPEEEDTPRPGPPWVAEWWGHCEPQRDPEDANHYYIPTNCEPRR